MDQEDYEEKIRNHSEDMEFPAERFSDEKRYQDALDGGKQYQLNGGKQEQCLPHDIAYYTRFDHIHEKRYKYLPQGTYKADYLAKCERRSNYPTLRNTTSPKTTSTSLDPQLLRLLSAADRGEHSPDVARSYFGTLHDDVSNVRKRLNGALDELKWVKSHACAVEGDLVTYHDKTKERYECAIYPYLTHQPQISTLPVEHQ